MEAGQEIRWKQHRKPIEILVRKPRSQLKVIRRNSPITLLKSRNGSGRWTHANPQSDDKDDYTYWKVWQSRSVSERLERESFFWGRSTEDTMNGTL